ncbi:unnamed protein product [Protopolystoma xenopodis]|uniref:Uncharacterized protein n=1 Tax=Protopolystoma xenopodis TaxID=117903 RepID=A0A448XP07_9PLAT|nr:unnamed protein product [Protopolystoma xenopodis]
MTALATILSRANPASKLPSFSCQRNMRLLKKIPPFLIFSFTPPYASPISGSSSLFLLFFAADFQLARPATTNLPPTTILSCLGSCWVGRNRGDRARRCPQSGHSSPSGLSLLALFCPRLGESHRDPASPVRLTPHTSASYHHAGL